MQNIKNALELFRDRLNGFIRGATQRNEDVVVLSNLMNSDGARALVAQDKIVLSLANIHLSTNPTISTRGVSSGDEDARFSPPVFTDLYLLILANFATGSYSCGLDLISRVIAFVQDNPVLDHSNVPGLDHDIDSLSFEFVNLDASQWSHYLRMAGVSYLPAVMYKLRMLPFRGDAPRTAAPGGTTSG
jgi:Pvc16 N-terminal domain